MPDNNPLGEDRRRQLIAAGIVVGTGTAAYVIRRGTPIPVVRTPRDLNPLRPSRSLAQIAIMSRALGDTGQVSYPIARAFELSGEGASPTSLRQNIFRPVASQAANRVRAAESMEIIKFALRGGLDSTLLASRDPIGLPNIADPALRELLSLPPQSRFPAAIRGPESAFRNPLRTPGQPSKPATTITGSPDFPGKIKYTAISNGYELSYYVEDRVAIIASLDRLPGAPSDPGIIRFIEEELAAHGVTDILYAPAQGGVGPRARAALFDEFIPGIERRLRARVQVMAMADTPRFASEADLIARVRQLTEQTFSSDPAIQQFAVQELERIRLGMSAANRVGGVPLPAPAAIAPRNPTSVNPLGEVDLSLELPPEPSGLEVVQARINALRQKVVLVGTFEQTFPVRRQLAALGGHFENGRWLIPASNFAEAQALLRGEGSLVAAQNIARQEARFAQFVAGTAQARPAPTGTLQEELAAGIRLAEANIRELTGNPLHLDMQAMGPYDPSPVFGEPPFYGDPIRPMGGPVPRSSRLRRLGPEPSTNIASEVAALLEDYRAGRIGPRPTARLILPAQRVVPLTPSQEVPVAAFAGPGRVVRRVSYPRPGAAFLMDMERLRDLGVPLAVRTPLVGAINFTMPGRANRLFAANYLRGGAQIVGRATTAVGRVAGRIASNPVVATVGLIGADLAARHYFPAAEPALDVFGGTLASQGQFLGPLYFAGAITQQAATLAEAATNVTEAVGNLRGFESDRQRINREAFSDLGPLIGGVPIYGLGVRDPRVVTTRNYIGPRYTEIDRPTAAMLAASSYGTIQRERLLAERAEVVRQQTQNSLLQSITAGVTGAIAGATDALTQPEEEPYVTPIYPAIEPMAEASDNPLSPEAPVIRVRGPRRRTGSVGQGGVFTPRQAPARPTGNNPLTMAFAASVVPSRSARPVARACGC